MNGVLLTPNITQSPRFLTIEAIKSFSYNFVFVVAMRLVVYNFLIKKLGHRNTLLIFLIVFSEISRHMTYTQPRQTSPTAKSLTQQNLRPVPNQIVKSGTHNLNQIKLPQLSLL